MSPNKGPVLTTALASAAVVIGLSFAGQALAAHTSAQTALADPTAAGSAAALVDAARQDAQPEATLRHDCRAKADELEAREDRGEIDWEVLEGRLDPELESDDTVALTLPSIDGAVAAPGERLDRPSYETDLGFDALTDADLLEAVVVCEDHGWLPDQEADEDDEQDRDEQDPDEEGPDEEGPDDALGDDGDIAPDES